MAEQTVLTPQEEQQFRAWAQANGVKNYDHPDAHYDMRGYWKSIASKGQSETSINAQDGLLHYPDTFKQHGHPSFSVESQYSGGPNDGGRWVGDNFVPGGADLLGTSRSTTDASALEQALRLLMNGLKQ